MVSMNCQECGTPFEAKRSDARFCLPCRDARKKATSKTWFEAHPEKWHDYNKVCNAKHKETRREQNKRWKANNPDKVAAKQHRNYERYKEKRLATNKQWAKDHPEEMKISRRMRNHRRRARVAQAEGEWTFEEFKALCEAYDNRCVYCQKQTDKLTADHMQPITRGGANTIENIVPACGTCNPAKGTSTVLEFLYPKYGLLLRRWDKEQAS